MSTTKRIIEVRVDGCYLTLSSHTAGVRGETNAAALRIVLDESWDGMAVTVTWWNARGGDETKRLLTADLLEELPESGRTYLVPIPGEAMVYEGNCRFALDGYTTGKRVRSVYGELVVRPTPGEPLGWTSDPTPTQAEQLQHQIDTLLEDLKAESRAAEWSSDEAQQHADAAAASAAQAKENAGFVDASVGDAKEYADRAADAADRADSAAGDATYEVAEAHRFAGQAEQSRRAAADCVQQAESAAAAAAASVQEAAASALTAAGCQTGAQEAWTGVQTAIKGIPSGATPIVNDLTTGGTKQALSAEQGKVLARRPNPNLLLNANFLQPVNQRGLTEITGAGYLIDGWRTRNATSGAALTEHGLRFTNSLAESNTLSHSVEDWQQYAGCTLTLSVLVHSATGACRVRAYTGDTSFFGVTFSEPGLYTATWKLDTAIDRLAVTARTVDAGASATLTAVKLELGSVQTLAALNADGSYTLCDPADTGRTLADCRRRFERIGTGGNNLSLGVGCGSATLIYVPIRLAPKRAAPSAAALSACVGHLRYGTNTLTGVPRSVTMYSFDPASGCGTLTVAGDFTAGAMYRLGIAAGGYLDFDSEM